MVDESGHTSGEDLTLEPAAMVSNARPRALWGVLAAVAVVAGALAVTSGGGDGAPPPLPVALGASGGREGTASAMAADMALAWVTYKAGDGLPALGGEAPAYRIDGAVDAARVRALADALGMTGEPTQQDRLWHLESDGAVLEVYEQGGGSWWFSANTLGKDVSVGSVSSSSGSDAGSAGPATTYPSTSVDCGAAVDCLTTETVGAECPPNADCIAPEPPIGGPCPPDASCTMPVPEPPAPPADLPSKDEARQIAVDLLAASGMDVTDAKVTVDGPYDAWYVTIEPRLDGVPLSGLGASVSVGSKGAITNASGTLGTADRLGDYPLIDTHAAIDRLNEQQGANGSGGIVPLAVRDGASASSGVATLEAPVTTALCATSEPPQCGEPTTTTYVSSCKVQPDGSEVCEGTGVPIPTQCAVPGVEPGTDPAVATDLPCVQRGGICAENAVPPATGGVTDTTIASPECADPVPYPEPQPIEVILTGAERVLVLLPSFDGLGEIYLVPGYRFSADDGTTLVEVAAVSDASLATTTTTTPGVSVTDPPPPPNSCEPLVEGDSSGTTHTINPCPQAVEPIVLEAGGTPEIGVGYYVGEVNTHCGTFTWAGQWWATDAQTPLPWSTPTEGGTFTLSTPDEGTFVGDAGRSKTATFTARGPEADIPGCA